MQHQTHIFLQEHTKICSTCQYFTVLLYTMVNDSIIFPESTLKSKQIKGTPSKAHDAWALEIHKDYVAAELI